MFMSEPIQLLVVDDHPLFRRGLIALLSQDDRFEIVGEAGDVGEALRVLAKTQPDLLLLDNHLPGVKGVDAIASLKSDRPNLRILMLTVSEDEEDLSKALQSGADGYLLKTSESDQLCDALVKVHEGHSVISPSMLNKLVSTMRHPANPTADAVGIMSFSKAAAIQSLDKLSPREKDIFLLIAKSLSNKQIARDLDIAETTVKIHIQHIFKKLDLTSRVQIAVFAATHGLS
ncbi:MAG: Transcriptional regulatory protein DegU [Pseudomonadota bacterium]|jgi:two-component system, NarL family, nitrate/nitrite response regulator NarL|uniref:DNA-binding response regulator n=1 Tax=Limnohabitans curvus TaxID=323423 RepID=A0A315G579_9BURK|nr:MULTISPECIES: response regulator [Limnohabitans]PQA80350.1 DNA-binding response regulator [Limnohabitans sp. TS-CS-82]PUE56287.1 DNA-binding response regulator [Limnohabitans sp. Rim8]PUE60867.1 DNA-binding response regulator [Limnohabitans curvus]